MQIPILKPGDSVEIIAPASRCTDVQLEQMKNLLENWGLNCIVASDIFGKDLLCANTDEVRLKHLQNACANPQTKAIFCARGGYGSLRLIPNLIKPDASIQPKTVIGMSDVTALQIYLQQQWGWPMLHGAAAPDRYSEESVNAIKQILFGEIDQVVFSDLKPLNKAAKQNQTIHSSVVGGNLCLVETGIGTKWQLDTTNKILLLEEVGERAYRVDRMLEHLRQAGLFDHVKAILLGDFLNGNEPDGTSLIDPVLQRFAESCDFPVMKISGIGHGKVNFPIPLGTAATLQCGVESQLICSR